MNPDSRWTDTEELLALVVEKIHELSLLTLQAHFETKGRLPAQLHIPRPGERAVVEAPRRQSEAPRRQSSNAEVRAFFGGGVQYVHKED